MARGTHHRGNDHSGNAPLSDFVLSVDLVGRYPTLPTYTAGTPIADVLNDLIDRLAVVPLTQLPQFSVDAVISKTVGNDTGLEFDGDAPEYLSFTIEAMIFDPAQSLTIDAVIV